MSGFRWKPEDDALVRAEYGRLKCSAIGRRLGRSGDAVMMRAAKLGIAGTHRPRAAYEEAVRERHALGWHDADIAGELGLCREAVGYHRRKLGLPSNAGNDRNREKVRRGVARQLRRLEFRSLSELRLTHARLACAAAGWPVAVSARQVKILESLTAGPKTREELSSANGCGESLNYLLRHGLVASLGRVRRRPGRRPVCLYRLADGVKRKGPAGGGVGAKTFRMPPIHSAAV